RKQRLRSTLSPAYGHCVSERAVAGTLRSSLRCSYSASLSPAIPDRLGVNRHRWWLSGWNNDAVVWRACQFSNPGGGGLSSSVAAGLVSGRWELLQLRHRRLLSLWGEGFHSLASPILGFVPDSGSGVVIGSWFLWFTALICWMRSRFNQ
ncbi:hypothetical protein HID58_049882, partial [Brassica napus]